MNLHPNPARMHMDGREWVDATVYDMAMEALREKQRSQQSHNHQFAAINDLWANLPIRHADAPYAKSADAFRKHGLIETGHCDVETISCESREAAIAAAPVVAALARRAHGYALVSVRGSLIVCATPHSQSFKAMGKDLFHQSKADVLAWGETLLGIREPQEVGA